jgi:hypothetical protein
MSDFAEYASCFPVGGRVSVGIPLDEGGTFQEWAVVGSLDRDLMELELSRDMLPQGAHLVLGNTLQVRRPEKDGGRCCRGVLVGEGEHGGLALRLVEGVMNFEPREYFRQDVYLPVDYQLPPSQQLIEVRERWRQRRLDRELAAQQPYPGEPEQLTALREAVRLRLEQRPTAPPSAANMSGGGVRFDTPERFTPSQLVELTIHLPQPEKVLELVGEVVSVQPAPHGEGFRTAMRFRFIDESDRDRIVGYISHEQLAQLARLARVEARGSQPSFRRGRARLLRLGLTLVLVAALVGYLAYSVVEKRQRGEKHEIERIFEESIAKYLKQRR